MTLLHGLALWALFFWDSLVRYFLAACEAIEKRENLPGPEGGMSQ